MCAWIGLGDGLVGMCAGDEGWVVDARQPEGLLCPAIIQGHVGVLWTREMAEEMASG